MSSILMDVLEPQLKEREKKIEEMARSKGIKEGENRIVELILFLRKEGRNEEEDRMLVDSAYRARLIHEYEAFKKEQSQADAAGDDFGW